jgi:hypothetical protein
MIATLELNLPVEQRINVKKKKAQSNISITLLELLND